MLEHLKSLLLTPKALIGAALAAAATVIIAAAVSWFTPADACTEPRAGGAEVNRSSSRPDFARDFGASPRAGTTSAAGELDSADGPTDVERATAATATGETAEGSEARHGTNRLPRVPPADAARVRALGFMVSEFQRRSSMSRASTNEEPSAEEEEPEYSNIRQYLIDSDEVASELLDVPDILGDPSNIVEQSSLTSVVAWDVRDREPRGSYLYVLQQDIESRIAQVHRYFCQERRLDILAESCVPVASVYSNSGAPVAVNYSSDDVPVQNEANDLDPSLFSRANQYVEANDFLLYLQQYFDDMRA